MTLLTFDLTGQCPCGREVRGVQVGNAVVRINSLRFRPTLTGFSWCEAVANRNEPAGHGKPTDVRGVLTAESEATVAVVRQKLRDRNARRRQERVA